MSIPVICDRCRSTGIAGEADFSNLGDLLEFHPVPVKPRVNGWDPEAQRAFVALLAATGSKRRAAVAINRAPHGAEQLMKRPDGAGFKAAVERARKIAAENGAMKLAQGVADAAARNAQLTPPSRLRGLPGPAAAPAEQADDLALVEEWRDRITTKLRMARRLYLQEISGCPGKRAAFEILSGFAVDWDKARTLDEQPDEPWTIPNFRKADMLLTGENGWLGDIAHGPNKLEELRHALNDYLVTIGKAPVEWGSGRIPDWAGKGGGEHDGKEGKQA